MGARVGHSRGRLLVGRGALAVVVATTACASPAASEHAAEWEGDSARYFNLPGGQAQIGVSSSEHGVVVRWRAPDGETWSEPEVAYDAAGMSFMYARIRVGGPTLVAVVTYSPSGTSFPEDIDTATREQWRESEADDVTAFVVCRDGACTATDRQHPTLYEPPQVSSDGEHAFLADLGGTYVTWHGDDVDIRRRDGIPSGEAGQPLLAPDGSLRAVYGVPDPGGCIYTLLTTEPGETGFVEAATYQDPTDHRDECATDLETFSSDYVVVSRPEHRRPWYLARVDGEWQRVTEDPSGQVHYPRLPGNRIAGVERRSGYWHWRQAVATSSDGRTLIVQMHFPGEERWGPPQEVVRARPGEQCTYIDPMPTYTSGEEDPFYINLRCRSRPAPGDEWVYSFPAAVTEDGRNWTSFQATDFGQRVGRNMLFCGHPTYRWSPEGGLRALDVDADNEDELTACSG